MGSRPSNGITSALTTRWAGLPSVIATAKPAITPLIGDIQGQALPEDFAPAFRSGKPTSAAEPGKALTAHGYTVLANNELNIPSGPEARGWLESGDLDHRGHQLQNDLPSVIADEIERLALLIQMLLDDGWHSVKVVTDHGWLFCPGGLPSAELPQHLTTSRRRLLVEDDELEGAAVVVVLLSPDGRVIARRRTVVGGEA